VDDRLSEIARELEGTRLAAEVFDPDWRLVAITEEMQDLLGEHDPEAIGIGEHAIVSRTRAVWNRTADADSRAAWGSANLPYILAETPAPILETIDPPGPDAGGFTQEMLEQLQPRPAPPTWVYRMLYRRPGFPPTAVTCLGVRYSDTDGSRIGSAIIYTAGLPATTLDLLVRGDPEMFERMARLIEPGRRAAAIVFADLQASGILSRRHSSASYFHLIRELTTAIDEVVGAHGGIVGKHAGDGVTAFFLATELGSASSAARAALDASRAIGEAAARVAGELDGVEPVDVLMNVGAHWSGALYLGQVVTGGRLEVTALGDEMNECARIQASARDGSALATKALLEQLAPAESEAVGIDPDRIAYRTLAELPGADEKSIRDAGSVAVAEV
jgi:class 3 adenylate cyclase